MKEVLSEVAFLHRSGEYNGLWELKENFKEEGVGDRYMLQWATNDVVHRSKGRMLGERVVMSRWRKMMMARTRRMRTRTRTRIWKKCPKETVQ